MADKSFTIHWENGDHRDFQAPSALVAFIRGLSYQFLTKKNSDISSIVCDAEAKIYYAWDWDVSYNEADKTFNPGSIKRYTEDDVQEMFESYVRYTGNSALLMRQWFDRNKK